MIEQEVNPFERCITIIDRTMIDGPNKALLLSTLKHGKYSAQLYDDLLNREPELRTVSGEDFMIMFTIMVDDKPIPFVGIPYSKYEELTCR